MITDPSKSAFSGFIVVGGAGLLNAALVSLLISTRNIALVKPHASQNIHRDWNIGGNAFLYTMWGLWWLNAAMAYIIAFGVIFSLLGRKPRDIAKVAPTWIIPVVALVSSSTCGGTFGDALITHSHKLALISSTFALTMGVIGLSFTTMITSSFLLRLLLYGVPEATTVLATFTTLTPLGQGGYSLLINGENLSQLLPAHLGYEFPQNQLAGQMIYSVCFCMAYILWCMGLAWITVSVFSISRRANKLPNFCVTHWCIVFPNGVFALLSVRLGNVLESPFYQGFGAAWSIIVFILWMGLAVRSIKPFIDGTMFLPPAPLQDHDDVETLCGPQEVLVQPSDPDTLISRPDTSLGHSDKPELSDLQNSRSSSPPCTEPDFTVKEGMA